MVVVVVDVVVVVAAVVVVVVVVVVGLQLSTATRKGPPPSTLPNRSKQTCARPLEPSTSSGPPARPSPVSA